MKERFLRLLADLLPLHTFSKGFLGPKGFVLLAAHVSQRSAQPPQRLDLFRRNEASLRKPIHDEEVIIELQGQFIRNSGSLPPEIPNLVISWCGKIEERLTNSPEGGPIAFCLVSHDASGPIA